jgi:hypothetical protein
MVRAGINALSDGQRYPLRTHNLYFEVIFLVLIDCHQPALRPHIPTQLNLLLYLPYYQLAHNFRIESGQVEI